MKKFYNELTTAQKAWIVCFSLGMIVLGLIARDTAINIFIGFIGAFYVSIYGTGKTRWAFILGVIYVSAYTIICLQNRIMLDAIQNVILIPLYIYSFIYWGKNETKPSNLSKKQTSITIVGAIITCCLLYGLSRILHGNYSGLDAVTTTATMFAMVLGIYGYSAAWLMWTVNNTVSVIIFGLALLTPTGSITVFAMKALFFINGLIGWYNFVKLGNEKEII